MQDRQGFLWFATVDGLNRYDGYDFETFTRDPDDRGSLPNGFIRCLIEDDGGRLWLGTYGGGLVVMDPRTEVMEVTRHDPEDPKSLASDDVRALYEDGTGNLWAGTRHGLSRIDPVAGPTHRFRHDPRRPESLAHDDVRAIHQDRHGFLWIGTNGGGLSRLDLGKSGPGSIEEDFVHYRHEPADPRSLVDDRVRAILEDRSGFLWVGTDAGLDRFDPRTASFGHYRHDPADPESVSSHRIRALYEDAEGRVWIGTRVEGVNLWQPETGSFLRFTHDPADPHSVASGSIYSILQDTAGVLWLASRESGVSYLDESRGAFTTFRYDPSHPDSLPGGRVTAIHEGPKGSLWLGTFEGGFGRLEPSNGNFEPHPQVFENRAPGARGPAIESILEDDSGGVWLGTRGAGLIHRSSTFEPLEHYRHDPSRPESLVDDRILSLLRDREGRLWVGTSSGLDRLVPETASFLHQSWDSEGSAAPRDNAVECLFEDRSGALWIGTQGGLIRLDPGQDGGFTHFRYDPDDSKSLGDDGVVAMLETRSGAFWVGTLGAGANLLDRATGRFLRFSDNDSPMGNIVSGILEDDRGRVWFATSKGLVQLEPETWAWLSYDVRDGLLDSQLDSGVFHRSRSGSFFLGSGEGINVFRPESFDRNRFVPPVVLTSFEIYSREDSFGQPISRLDEIELGHRDNFFSFEFAALSFRRPDKSRYRFKLEGLEDRWIEAETRRHASYTNVSPGEYRFRVQGSNNDQVWNREGASVRIVIRPPWWRSWWAYGGYGLLLLIGLFGIDHYQRAQLIRKEREQAQQREVELLKEKNDEILRTQAQLIHAEKMASLGQLVAGVAHEINNPVNFISSGLPSLRRDVAKLANRVPEERRDPAFVKLRERVEQLIEVIGEGSRRTAEIVGHLRTFSRLDEAEVKAVDLNHALDSTLSLLRHRTGRGIRIIRDHGDLPKVECYGSQINQVFMNLLVNAIQAIEGEGTITLTTAVLDDERVVISIHDTGCGIEEDVRRRIFDPFFTTKPVGQGTGLGLSISHGIIEKHRGTLEVTSTPGEGSEFTLVLPIRLVPRDKEFRVLD